MMLDSASGVGCSSGYTELDEVEVIDGVVGVEAARLEGIEGRHGLREGAMKGKVGEGLDERLVWD